MTAIYQPQYQIAAGNNNTAGLVALESITPAGDIQFAPVRAYWNYTPGSQRTRADGTLYFAGFASQAWICRVLTKAQWQYLKTTYCNGGYSGEVTIRTRFGNPDAYANYNAILNLPVESATTQASRVFTDIQLTFTRLQSI